MKVELLPLNDRKYYGTIVQILDGPLEGNEIKVWMRSDDYKYGGSEPSERELAAAGVSREEHERLRAANYCSTPVDMSGGHYESIETLRVAEAIVRALTVLGTDNLKG